MIMMMESLVGTIRKGLEGLMLSDPENEVAQETPDRVTVSGSINMTSVDQMSISKLCVGNYVPERLPSALDLGGTKETVGEKFYYVGDWAWDATSLAYTRHDIDVVKELVKADFAASGLLRYHTYCRFGIELMVQINPTPFQQGILQVTLVPGDPWKSSLCSYLCMPSVLLNCNINNMGFLKVPWVHTRGMHRLGTKSEQYVPWYVRVLVLSQLHSATGTSQKCHVTILGRFCDLEVHGMRPETQMFKQISLSASSYALNLGNCKSSVAKVDMSLGGDMFLSEDSCAGGTVLKHLSTWTDVPGLAGRFTIHTSDNAGKVLGVIPVSPFYCAETYSSSIAGTTPCGSVASMFCFWRGDMVFQFQCAPTKYHSARILVMFYPGSDIKDPNDHFKSMTLRKAVNGPCSIMDVSGVQSTMVFRVPWTCDTPYRYNRNSTAGQIPGQSECIGHLLLFVYNPLVCPGNVVPKVEILIWISMANAKFMAPIFTHPGSKTQMLEPENSGFTSTHEERQKLDVQEDTTSRPVQGVSSSIEDPHLRQLAKGTFPELPDGEERHTIDHMDLKYIMGRSYFYTFKTFLTSAANTEVEYTFPIDLNVTRETDHPVQHPSGVLQWFLSLFHLMRGPLDVTIYFQGNHDADVTIWYTPEGVAHQTAWAEQTGHLLKSAFKSSLGVVKLHTGQTRAVQMRLPFYTPLVAISPNLLDKATDSVFGYLTVQVHHYIKSNDNKLSMAVYISFPEETKFYFRRGPSSNSYLRDVDDTVRRMMTYEPEETDEDKEFNRKLYKDLRMQVGLKRLEYAHKELGRSKSLGNILETQCLLYPEGMVLETLENGVVKHGIVVNGLVLTVKKKSSLFSRTGGFTTENFSGWTKTMREVDEYLLAKLKSFDLSKYEFNWDKFVDSGIIDCGPSQDMLNSFFSDKWTTLSNVLKPQNLTMVDKALSGSKLDHFVGEAQKLLEESRTFLEGLKKHISEIQENLGFAIGKLLFKVLVSAMKISLTIYIGAKTEWDKQLMGPLMGIVGLEVCSAGYTCISDVFGLLSKRKQEVLKSQMSLKDFSLALSTFKNFKDVFVWVVEQLQKVYEKVSGKEKRKHTMLKLLVGKMEAHMCEVDDICNQPMDTDRWKRSLEIQREMRAVLMEFGDDPEIRSHLVFYRDSVNKLASKLRDCPSQSDEVFRSEPVVTYLCGERGSGKSMLAMAIATKLCVENGCDPKANIYTRPVDSDYWDGYKGQLVCIIDDIGQNPDDKDWATFCQLVSTTPFRVNMAHLDNKGKLFCSPFIICTSNLEVPSPKTVYCQEAVLRRLHFKATVSPSEDCVKTLGNMKLLDVSVAKEKGRIHDMSCVEIKMDGQVIRMDQLVTSLLQKHRSRVKDVDEFMQLWSQGSPKLQGLCEFLRNHKVAVIGTVFSLVSVVALGFGLYKIFSRKIEAEGAYSGMPQPSTLVRLGGLRHSQSTIDIAALVQKNLCKFGSSKEGESVRWHLNCLGICDDWCVVPKHVILHMENQLHDVIYVQKGSTCYTLSIKDAIFKDLDSEYCDLILLKITGMPKFKDLREHLVSKSRLEEAVGYPATLCTLVGGLYQLVAEGPVELLEQTSYMHTTAEGKSVELTIPMAFRGAGHSVAGSCGGALVSGNNRLQNAIIGIHTAGGAGQMVSKAVYKEMFVDFDSLDNYRVRNVSIVEQCAPVVTRSEIRESPIHELFPSEVTHKPASLRVSPSNVEVLAVALEKYRKPVLLQENLKLEGDVVYEKLRPICNVEGLLDERQAVCGIQGLDGIDLNTSAGIPYSILGKKKREMFVDGVFVDEVYRKRLRCNLSRLFAGMHLDCVFQWFPKDELRTLEKVNMGKTRFVEGCPLDVCVITRIVYGKVMACIYSSPGFSTGIAVGIDCDSCWSSLFVKAKSFGDMCLALDFRNFDASLGPAILYQAVRVLNKLSHQSKYVLRSIYHTIAFADHQYSCLRFKTVGGLPSGFACTSLINSLCNLICLVRALSRSQGVAPWRVWDSFMPLTYGDDVLLVVKRGVDVNVKAFVCELEALNLEVTGSDKGPVKLCKLEEAEFLKRRFVWVSGQIRPGISEQTIWNLLLWKRKRARYQDNVLNAFWFASAHGPKFYNELRARVLPCLEARGYYVPSYEAMNMRWHDLSYIVKHFD
uniref:Genome polyprotein n=1 Tax=Waterwitch virus TaxID=2776963 RepID=A0A8E4QJ92_9PICO|nr:MAG: polyprotein [Waterwitch virus]